MNQVCANCGGYIGDYIVAGTGDVKICNCRYQDQPTSKDIQPGQAITLPDGRIVPANPTSKDCTHDHPGCLVQAILNPDHPEHGRFLCKVCGAYFDPPDQPTSKDWDSPVAKSSKSPRWKGESASKSSKHQYLIKHFGQPRICESPTCDGKTEKRWFDWALKRGRTYSHNREDYLRLCRACHRRYDLTPELEEKGKKNLWWAKEGQRSPTPARKLTDEQVIEIRERYAKGDISQMQLGREYGVTGENIYHIVRRKIWKYI